MHAFLVNSTYTLAFNFVIGFCLVQAADTFLKPKKVSKRVTLRVNKACSKKGN